MPPGVVVPRNGARAAQRARALRYIDEHLADPELAPRAIADALGCSVRYLHLVFAEDGRSVGATILAQRLARCRAALVDPCERRRTITEIAFAWGFNDVSHFGRAFRRRYAMTPRQARGR